MNCPMNVVSNAQIAFKKRIFRLDQLMRMLSSNKLINVHAHRLVQPQVSMGTGASNGRCSDTMTLPINDWIFNLEGATIPPYCALHFHKYGSEPSLYFYSLWHNGRKGGAREVSICLFVCIVCLSLCLFCVVSLSVFIFVCLSVFSVCLFVFMSVCLFLYFLSVCLSV